MHLYEWNNNSWVYMYIDLPSMVGHARLQWLSHNYLYMYEGLIFVIIVVDQKFPATKLDTTSALAYMEL